MELEGAKLAQHFPNSHEAAQAFRCTTNHVMQMHFLVHFLEFEEAMRPQILEIKAQSSDQEMTKHDLADLYLNYLDQTETT